MRLLRSQRVPPRHTFQSRYYHVVMATEAEVIAKERKALMKLMDSAAHRIPKREVDENLLIATWNIAQFSNKKHE